MDDSFSLLLLSNHQLNENEVDYLALLLTIIESKNWVALQCSICSSPDTVQRELFTRKVARVPHLNLNGCHCKFLSICSASFFRIFTIYHVQVAIRFKSANCVHFFYCYSYVYVLQSLHACVRFNPPLHIVQFLIELLPESTNFVDCMNRTPLHFAAGTRADLSIIQLLVNSSHFSCSIRDVNVMTPRI